MDVARDVSGSEDYEDLDPQLKARTFPARISYSWTFLGPGLQSEFVNSRYPP